MGKTSLYKEYFLESLNVRKNSKGLMGSKTKVHKDKKKDASKKMGRKKVKEEDDSSYADGSLGPNAAVGHSQSSDWYAPGDNRIPFAFGVVQTRKGAIKSKRRRKKKKKK